MRIPTRISEIHSPILSIFIPLAVGAVSVSSPGQASQSITNCDTIIDTRDEAPLLLRGNNS
jgi:hypothetical protein